MAQHVEVSLRIPNMKVRPLDTHGYPIDHASVRFKRMIEVASIPKAGEALSLPTASGRMLPAAVVRADWNDDRELFIVACQYANRSLSSDDYAALVSDPEWRMTPLI
jgi:hypothetical protein